MVDVKPMMTKFMEQMPNMMFLLTTIASKLAVWNADGLVQHFQEIKAFIQEKNIDIMLMPAKNLTDKNFVNVPNFYVYNAKHPAKTARGSSVNIIKCSILHANNPNYCETHIHCTSVTVNDSREKLTLASL